MKNRDDPNSILPMEGDLSEAWLIGESERIFASLQNKMLFDILCRIAISKTFPGTDLEVFRNSKYILASTERVVVISLAENLANLKTKNHDLFFRLLTRLCQKRFQGGRVPWVLKNGTPVYAERKNHLIKWAALPYLPHALATTSVPKDERLRNFIAVQYDLSAYVGGYIGTVGCVETGPDDDIVYAYRIGERAFPDRFVLKRTRVPTNHIHLSIRLTGLNYYNLFGLGFGCFLRPVPHRDNQLYNLLDDVTKEECRVFWRTHAFVFSKRKIRAPVSRKIPVGWDV
jgi:hypothetical protein